MLLEELTSLILAAYYEVYNKLGAGFLEKVYENALMIELNKRGLDAKQQVPICVYYEGQIVGEYFADVLVNDLVILELKTADEIARTHEYQLINYLRATELEVGLILNFGAKAELKRKVFSNQRKTSLKGV
jgi:GxxExxY protein